MGEEQLVRLASSLMLELLPSGCAGEGSCVMLPNGDPLPLAVWSFMYATVLVTGCRSKLCRNGCSSWMLLIGCRSRLCRIVPAATC